MQYIAPFYRVALCLGLKGAKESTRFVCPLESVIDVVRHLLAAVPVDEKWYIEKYPDVRQALNRSLHFKSATQHYIAVGYFDGRLPFERETEEVRYPLAFSALKKGLKAIPVRGQMMVEFSYREFLDLIRRVIAATPVDAAWYLRLYPEVSGGISRGHFRSAREHFLWSGYFENRLPFEMRIDEDWYISAYEDLKAVKRSNPSFSAAHHFVHFGYREGRRPHPLALESIFGAL